MDSLEESALYLICQIADETFAFPAAAIERVLRMTALTSLPGGCEAIMGAVNIAGSSLPVVDSHRVLSLPSPSIHPDQHLLLTSNGSRFAIWVDRVDRSALISPEDMEAAPLPQTGSLACGIAHIQQECVPVLLPELFLDAAIHGWGERSKA